MLWLDLNLNPFLAAYFEPFLAALPGVHHLAVIVPSLFLARIRQFISHLFQRTFLPDRPESGRILVDPYLTQVDVGGLLIHMQRIIQRYYMLPKFLPMPFPKVIKYGCKLISAHVGILVPDLVDYLLRTRCAPFEQVYRVFAAFLMP